MFELPVLVASKPEESVVKESSFDASDLLYRASFRVDTNFNGWSLVLLTCEPVDLTFEPVECWTGESKAVFVAFGLRPLFLAGSPFFLYFVICK